MLKKIFLSFLLTCFINAYLCAERIAIIGGGFSGLTAAYELIQNNVHENHEIVLFEGRDRLGGRVHTHYFDETKNKFYEEGGTFIDADHKEIIKLTKELNLKLRKSSFVKRDLFVVNDNKFLKTKVNYKLVNVLVNFLDKILESINDKDLIFYNQDKDQYEYAKAIDFLEGLDPIARNFLETYYFDEAGLDLNNMPVTAFYWINDDLKEIRQLLDIKKSKIKRTLLSGIANKLAYRYSVEGGMSRLVDALQQLIEKNNVRITLDSKLVFIKKEGDVYKLGFDGQEEVEADRIIVTLPFSTLRYVDLNVPLTDLQRQAIETLPYGQHIKIGIPLDANRDIAKDLLYYVNLDHQFIGWSGQHAMTFFVGSSKSQECNPEALSEQLMPGLQSKYRYIKNVGEPIVKNWVIDPFALGTYSGCSTDCNINIFNPSQKIPSIRAYADPSEDNRFFLAGEHIMNDGSAGHMEGAVRSGKIMAGFLFKSLLQ